MPRLAHWLHEKNFTSPSFSVQDLKTVFKSSSRDGIDEIAVELDQKKPASNESQRYTTG